MRKKDFSGSFCMPGVWVIMGISEIIEGKKKINPIIQIISKSEHVQNSVIISGV